MCAEDTGWPVGLQTCLSAVAQRRSDIKADSAAGIDSDEHFSGLVAWGHGSRVHYVRILPDLSGPLASFHLCLCHVGRIRDCRCDVVVQAASDVRTRAQPVRSSASRHQGTEKLIYSSIFPLPKRCPASIVEGRRRVPQHESHLWTRLSGVLSPAFRQATSTPSWGDHALIDPEAHAWALANRAVSHAPGMSELHEKTEFSRTCLIRLLYYG